MQLLGVGNIIAIEDIFSVQHEYD